MGRVTWSKSVSAKGTVGTNLTVTPASGSQNILFRMIVNAPLANDDCTLKIYSDSVAAANLHFDGYMADRDDEGAIEFPAGKTCTTNWIVVTSGGSGDLFARADYR